MDLEQAPLFTDLSPGPKDGAAWWLRAADDVRLRIAVWGRDAHQGTVLLFPGRTEYIEKYAPAAADLLARGFCTLSIDWRGQGRADRALDDPLVGHVGDFHEFQLDVEAALRAANALDLPKPWYMIGHSMGGCIGLRALMRDLPVKAAAFTGPMWGIKIEPHLRPAAWTLSWLMPKIGRGGQLPPGTKTKPYVLSDPFEDNMLTNDADMFDMMRAHLETHPEIALGGPSFTWLGAALRECADMAKRPSPGVPCLTYLGTNERIVDVPRIHDRMDRWSNGGLELVDQGEHEVMMDTPEVRARVFDGLAAHFLAHR
jgi:lysophospholipase